MTIEELKEFAGTEDGAAIVADFMKDAGYLSKDDISGLENKKNELLGKLKKAQGEKEATLKLFEKYDIVDTEDLGSKLATLANAQSNESDVEKLQRRLEIIEKSAKAAEDRANAEKVLRTASEKKAQIVSALKEAHVNDESFDVLLPYFDRLVKTEEADGKINLIVDSDDGPSPFNSFVDEWTKSDKAKQFIKAPSNSGGGAGGPGGSSSANMTMEQIATMPNREDRLKAMAELGQNT